MEKSRGQLTSSAPAADLAEHPLTLITSGLHNKSSGSGRRWSSESGFQDRMLDVVGVLGQVGADPGRQLGADQLGLNPHVRLPAVAGLDADDDPLQGVPMHGSTSLGVQRQAPAQLVHADGLVARPGAEPHREDVGPVEGVELPGDLRPSSVRVVDREVLPAGVEQRAWVKPGQDVDDLLLPVGAVGDASREEHAGPPGDSMGQRRKRIKGGDDLHVKVFHPP